MDYSSLMTTRYHEERAFGRTPKEAAQQSLEHCSQSIVDYINNRRIEAAQKLLETTELSISAVAEWSSWKCR